MRNIIILVLIIVALAIVRALISDVSRAVSKAVGSDKKKAAADAKPDGKTGRFVRDPHTGAYIDEESAIRVTLDGEPLFFESAQTRDAFLRNRTQS